MVCFDTPSSRATSSVARPASTCFSAAIICASLCLLMLIRFPFPSSEIVLHLGRIQGGTSSSALLGRRNSYPSSEPLPDEPSLSEYGMLNTPCPPGALQRSGKVTAAQFDGTEVRCVA